MAKYKKGCIFGDFDRIHAGHKAAMTTLLDQCKTVLIVLTRSPEKKSPPGKSWGINDELKRKNELLDFVDSLGATDRVSYVAYENLEEAVADGHNLEIDAIINPVKDIGPCLDTNYAIVEANCIKAGIKPPALVWVDTVMEPGGVKTLSSSRLRKRAKDEV